MFIIFSSSFLWNFPVFFFFKWFSVWRCDFITISNYTEQMIIFIARISTTRIHKMSKCCTDFGNFGQRWTNTVWCVCVWKGKKSICFRIVSFVILFKHFSVHNDFVHTQCMAFGVHFIRMKKKIFAFLASKIIERRKIHTQRTKSNEGKKKHNKQYNVRYWRKSKTCTFIYIFFLFPFRSCVFIAELRNKINV